MIKKPKSTYNPNYQIVLKNPYHEISLACRQITTSRGQGTGFIFKYKGKFFLITAAHVVVNKNRFSKKKIAIDYDYEENPRFYMANIYYHPNNDVDLCLVALPENYDTKYFLEYHNEAVTITSEMFLFGYPGVIDIIHGITHKDGYSFPLPFIRKGIVAQMTEVDDIPVIILDINSVIGFSGGPIVGFDKRKKPYVIGINTARTIKYENIYNNDGDELDQITASPTGLLIAFHISYAIDIIETNSLV